MQFRCEMPYSVIPEARESVQHPQMLLGESCTQNTRRSLLNGGRRLDYVGVQQMLVFGEPSHNEEKGSKYCEWKHRGGYEIEVLMG